MGMASIALIGAGVIGETVLSGLIGAGHAPASITIVEKRTERRSELVDRYRVRAAALDAAVAEADIVVLVVKPQDMVGVLREVAPHVRKGATIVSLAAGVTIGAIEGALGPEVAVVRIMPNTPALVGKGMFVATPGSACSAEQLDVALDLLRPSGRVLVVPEDQQDAVTALSGSGPAYVFLVAEAMESAGRALGLPAETAEQLTVQTVLGAAHMLAAGGDDAATLRHKVTSPHGTTEAALAVLEERGLRDAFEAALRAARDRSNELAR